MKIKKWNFTCKYLTITILLCVFFVLLCPSISPTLCMQNEIVEFNYGNLNFTYNLSKNIKSSSQFDLSYEINKFERFSSTIKRQELLKQLKTSGFDDKISINYLFPNMDKQIEKIKKLIETKSIDAKLTTDYLTEQVFFISPEKKGIKLDEQKLYENIVNNYLSNKSMIFSLPVIEINPQKTMKDYKKFCNLRADFSTDISSSNSNRKHNIKNAMTALCGVEIYPGEVFSFNKTIGRRTEENGYREANIIIDNEFTPGLGGGVCQVSSTLYNSALLAGLKIIEANKHSKPVGYVKKGFDAMVNFGSSDLKFKNTTNEKLTIVTNFSQSEIRIRIFGESMNGYTYKLINEIVNTIEPNTEFQTDDNLEYTDKVEYEDESFVLKHGTNGYEVKTYREKYLNGNLDSVELLRHDKFKPQNTIVIVGTKKRTTESA